MNPYWQIAFEHLSVEELEEILAKKRQGEKLNPITERERHINELMKLF